MRIPAGSTVVVLYFALAVAIGALSRRGSRGGADAYLNASRSLPLPIVTAAYLAANCGALEMIGLSAVAAQYGVAAFHFYWIGAIPAMIFLALWMMPVYRRSGIRTLPEYLELRFGAPVRLANACVLAITTLLLGGISLYAMGQVLDVVAGLGFVTSVLLSGTVVLVYVLLGGLRATTYNEVFQLLVIVAGVLPLTIRSLRGPAPYATAHNPARLHLWQMPLLSKGAPLDAAGVVLGLGFVLSFGYWCTDFVLMQRAFTARTGREARQVPLWAGFGKLLFSFMVVYPALRLAPLLPGLGHTLRYDQALPGLMRLMYGPRMIGLGMTALAASLMSGLAANVSAFAAVWTEDIYARTLRPGKEDEHYLRVAHISTVVAIAMSVLASTLNFLFSNLMEHVQLIFSLFGSPFWAVFLLGMSTRRVGTRGALAGLAAGVFTGLTHLIFVRTGLLRYGSGMTASFYSAIATFTVTLLVALLASRGRCPDREQNAGLRFTWATAFQGRGVGWLWLLAGLLLACTVGVNVVWR